MTSLSTSLTLLPLAFLVCLWCTPRPINAKPMTSEVPLKLALASQDYLDLQAILGKSLPGTPAEKAKVIDLLLQLLAEIDLPTLCNVIGNDTSFKEYNSMNTGNSVSATTFETSQDLPSSDDKPTQDAKKAGLENENENEKKIDPLPTEADEVKPKENDSEKDSDEKPQTEDDTKMASNSTTSPKTDTDDAKNSPINSIKARPFKVVVRPWKQRAGKKVNTDGALPYPLRFLGRKRPFLNTRFIKNTKDLKKFGLPQKYSVALPFNVMRRRKMAKFGGRGKKGNYFIRSVGIRKPKAELYSQSLVLGEWMNEHAKGADFSGKNPTIKPVQIVRPTDLAKDNDMYDEEKDDAIVKDTKLGRRVMLVVRKGGKKGMPRKRVVYRKRNINAAAAGRGPIQYSVVRQVSAPLPKGQSKAGQKLVKKRFFLPRESLKQRLYRAKGDRFGAGGHRIVRNGGSKRRFIPGRTRVLRVRAGPQKRVVKTSGHRRALYPNKRRIVMKAVGGGLDEYKNKGLAAFGEYADGYDNHIDTETKFSSKFEQTSQENLVSGSTTYPSDKTTTVTIPMTKQLGPDSNENVDVDVDEIDYIVPTLKTEDVDEGDSSVSTEALDQSQENDEFEDTLDMEDMVDDGEFEDVLEDEDDVIESLDDDDSYEGEASEEDEEFYDSTEVYETLPTTTPSNEIETENTYTQTPAADNHIVLSENEKNSAHESSTLSIQVTPESTLSDDIQTTTHNIETSSRFEANKVQSLDDSQTDNMPAENKTNKAIDLTSTIPSLEAYKGITSSTKTESTFTTSTNSPTLARSTVPIESTESNKEIINSETNIEQSTDDEELVFQNTHVTTNIPEVVEVTESSVVNEKSSLKNAIMNEISEESKTTTSLDVMREQLDKFYNEIIESEIEKNTIASNGTGFDNKSDSDITPILKSTIQMKENDGETTMVNPVMTSTSSDIAANTTKALTNNTDDAEIVIDPFMASLGERLDDETGDSEEDIELSHSSPTSDEKTASDQTTITSNATSSNETLLEVDASDVDVISTAVKRPDQIETGEKYASLTREQPRHNLTLETLMNIPTQLNATKRNQSETLLQMLDERKRTQINEFGSRKTTPDIIDEIATLVTNSDLSEKKSQQSTTGTTEKINKDGELTDGIFIAKTTTLSSVASEETMTEFETEVFKNQLATDSVATNTLDEMSTAKDISSSMGSSTQEHKDMTTPSNVGRVTESLESEYSDSTILVRESSQTSNGNENTSTERILIKPAHIDFRNNTKEEKIPINRPASISRPSQTIPLTVSDETSSIRTPTTTSTVSSTTHSDSETTTMLPVSSEETTINSNVASSDGKLLDDDASDVDVISTAVKRPDQTETGEKYASLTREQPRHNLTFETLMNITTYLNSTKMNQSETLLHMLEERKSAQNNHESDDTDAFSTEDTTTATTKITATETTPAITLTSTVDVSISEITNEDVSKSTQGPDFIKSEKAKSTLPSSMKVALPTLAISLNDEDVLNLDENEQDLNEIEFNEVTTDAVTTNGLDAITSTSKVTEFTNAQSEEGENVRTSIASNEPEVTTHASNEYDQGMAWEPIEFGKTFGDKLKPMGDFTYWKKPRSSLFHARFSDWIGPDGRKDYVDPKTNKIDLWKAYNIALTKDEKFDGNDKMLPERLSKSGERNYLWNARTWTNSIANPGQNPSLNNKYYDGADKDIQQRSGEYRLKDKTVKAFPKENNYKKDHTIDWGQRFSQGFYGRVYDQRRPSKSRFNPKLFSNQRFGFGKEDSLSSFEQPYKSKPFEENSAQSGSKTQSEHIKSPQIIVSKPQTSNDFNDVDTRGLWFDNEAAFHNNYQHKQFDTHAPKNVPLTSESASQEEHVKTESKLQDNKQDVHPKQVSNAAVFQSNEHLGPMGVAAPDDFTCPGLFGYYSDPEDCQAFFICSWKVPYRLSCPSGTRWNAQVSVCDWAANVPCPQQDFRSSSGIDSAEY